MPPRPAGWASASSSRTPRAAATPPRSRAPPTDRAPTSLTCGSSWANDRAERGAGGAGAGRHRGARGAARPRAAGAAPRAGPHGHVDRTGDHPGRTGDRPGRAGGRANGAGDSGPAGRQVGALRADAGEGSRPVRAGGPPRRPVPRPRVDAGRPRRAAPRGRHALALGTASDHHDPGRPRRPDPAGVAARLVGARADRRPGAPVGRQRVLPRQVQLRVLRHAVRVLPGQPVRQRADRGAGPVQHPVRAVARTGVPRAVRAGPAARLRAHGGGAGGCGGRLRAPALGPGGAHARPLPPRGARRGLEEVALYSPNWKAFITAPAQSWLWGPAHEAARDAMQAPAETTLLPGFMLIGLAVAGLFFSIWSLRVRLGLLAGVVVSVIFALGPNFCGGDFTYDLLFKYAPGWQGIRTPGRLAVWTTLLLAILAAGAVGSLVQRSYELAAERVPYRPSLPMRFGTLIPLILVLVEGANKVEHPVVPLQPVAGRDAVGPKMVDRKS